MGAGRYCTKKVMLLPIVGMLLVSTLRLQMFLLDFAEESNSLVVTSVDVESIRTTKDSSNKLSEMVTQYSPCVETTEIKLRLRDHPGLVPGWESVC